MNCSIFSFFDKLDKFMKQPIKVEAKKCNRELLQGQLTIKMPWFDTNLLGVYGVNIISIHFMAFGH